MAVKGEGALLYDLDGRRFIDFAGAIGTLNVGHSHPKVVEAVKKQAEDLIHPGFNVMMYPSYIELAEKLCALAPGDHAKKRFFSIRGGSGGKRRENRQKIHEAPGCRVIYKRVPRPHEHDDEHDEQGEAL